MHQVIFEQLYQHSQYRKHSLIITSFFVSYNDIISLLNHTPFFSIFQHTVHKNKINLHIHNNMMYTSNYQWTTISILPVFDNFQFLSTCRILCILVKYIFPWPYTIPFIIFTICIKAVVLRQWINSMPIATPSPFLWPLLCSQTWLKVEGEYSILSHAIKAQFCCKLKPSST